MTQPSSVSVSIIFVIVRISRADIPEAKKTNSRDGKSPVHVRLAIPESLDLKHPDCNTLSTFQSGLSISSTV
jgi:hypothetical protein